MIKHLLVISGGVGKRYGDSIPKQYTRNEHGTMLITNSCIPFVGKQFDTVTFVANEEYWDLIKSEVSTLFDRADINFVTQGKERQDSVNNGIYFIVKKYGLDEESYVFTQEAVRPFVTSELVANLINAPKEWDNVVPAINPPNVFGFVENGKVGKLIPKTDIVELQQPKRYHLKTIHNLISDSNYNSSTILDELNLFIDSGRKINIIEGAVFNVKITFPEHKKII